MNRVAARYLTRLAATRIIAGAITLLELAVEAGLGHRDDHDKPLHGTGPWCPTCGRQKR